MRRPFFLSVACEFLHILIIFFFNSIYLFIPYKIYFLSHMQKILVTLTFGSKFPVEEHLFLCFVGPWKGLSFLFFLPASLSEGRFSQQLLKPEYIEASQLRDTLICPGVWT